jgi:hypothetical protein
MLRVPTSIALSLLTGSLAIAQVQKGPQAAGPPPGKLTNFLDTEKSVFAKWHIAPIIVSENEQVGDIIDSDTTALIAGADDCFPGLAPRKGSSTLPAFTILSERGLAAALRAGDTIGAGGEVSKAQQFLLDFKDVQVAKVSTVQLRERLNSKIPECAKIRPFIDASYVPVQQLKQKNKVTAIVSNNVNNAFDLSIIKGEGTAISDKPPPLLVGTLFSARRVIRVITTEKLDAKAKLSFAGQLMADLGLGSKFGLSAEGGTEATNAFTIESKDIVPVALVPAFVVTESRKLASGITEYKLAAVDPDAINESIKIARAIEDNSFEGVVAAWNDPTGNLRDQFVILDPKTWTFEPHPAREKPGLVAAQSTIDSKRSGYRVLYAVERNQTFAKPSMMLIPN